MADFRVLIIGGQAERLGRLLTDELVDRTSALAGASERLLFPINHNTFNTNISGSALCVHR